MRLLLPLLPLVWFGAVGAGYAEVLRISAHCADLDGKHGDGSAFDAGHALFQVWEGEGEYFVSGPAAWEQGEFYGPDVAARPITCQIGGKELSFRLANYRIEDGFERYQVELWVNDRLAFRSGPSPENSRRFADLWDVSFKGFIEFEGSVRVCQHVVTGQGHAPPPPMVLESDSVQMTEEEKLALREKEKASRERAQLAFESSSEPSDRFFNLQGEFRCG